MLHNKYIKLVLSASIYIYIEKQILQLKNQEFVHQGYSVILKTNNN